MAPALIAIEVRDNKVTTFIDLRIDQQELALTVPATHEHGFRCRRLPLGSAVQQYGLENYLDLFMPRQRLALSTFATAIASLSDQIEGDAVRAGLADDGAPLEAGGAGARAYADAILAVLSLCLGKMAQSNNILVRWFVDPRNGSGKATPAFDRHAVPMVWDFVETNPFGGSVGDWLGPVMETSLRAFELAASSGPIPQITQADARDVARQLPPRCLIATDPPYYANIGYADLSDFFYVWIRQALKASFPSLLATAATPKDAELIASPYRHDGSIDRANAFFRDGFRDVFGDLARASDADYPLLIVYAMRQTEGSGPRGDGDTPSTRTGWEVFLEGLVEAGLSIEATWPVRTTTDTRMIGLGNNALATAIFVVARSRTIQAGDATLREFAARLDSVLPPAVNALRSANIAPVDMEQASIGPGMAAFTAFRKVVDAEGRRVTVGQALRMINRSLAEVLATGVGDIDPATRWAMAWYEQFGFGEAEYGHADSISRAKNTSVEALVDEGLVLSRAGRVRLLRPDELSAVGSTGTSWVVAHVIATALATEGEAAAAEALARASSLGESARDLAYHLFSVAVRRKRPQDALLYNGLVQSWPEIVRLSREPQPRGPEQRELFGEV